MQGCLKFWPLVGDNITKIGDKLFSLKRKNSKISNMRNGTKNRSQTNLEIREMFACAGSQRDHPYILRFAYKLGCILYTVCILLHEN